MNTDFHCHVLPGIDDGAGSIDESLNMLHQLWGQGIRRVVATPHFYPQYDTPDAFLRRRDESEKALRACMAGAQPLPELEIGAEVYFFRGMSQSDALKDLTIRGKRCILVELPLGFPEEDVFRELENIREKHDIVPIIAHIDRYISPFRSRGLPGKFAELPVMVQANAEFFLNRTTVNMAMRMLKANQIQLLGSDCHNTRDRAPNLIHATDAIRKKLGQRVLDRVQRYERELLGVKRL